MDPTILQLFSAEEILERLGQQTRTGCFHVFTPRESANVFFKDGLVVAAARGLSEGEEVLRQIAEWKDARFIWQPDIGASTPPRKALQINIRDFLAKQKRGTEKIKHPKTLTETSHSHFSIPTKGATTDKIPNNPPQPALAPKSVVTAKPASASYADLATTKTIDPSGQSRPAQEEALLEKYKLVLVSRETPEVKFKIVKVNSLVGRNPACDIAISHPSISRQHCLMQITDRGLHVKDLDTTNGTTVNDIVLKEGYINAGDKLTIGRVGFVLEKQ